MPNSGRIALALSLALMPACDSRKQAASDPASDAHARPPAADSNKAGSGASAPAPHAAQPAHPHGSPVANPHAAMPAGAPEPPAGPPRDVTPSGDVVNETLAEFTLSVPTEWEKGKPRGMMRMAQWTVPGPGGDAEMVVYRFKGGAGGVEANMARWKGQFSPPEGKKLDDIAKVGELEVGPLKVSTLDVAGRYVAAMRPGAAETHNKEDHRMLAVIVQNSGDPIFIKAVGPAQTLAVWADAWSTMVGSIKIAG